MAEIRTEIDLLDSWFRIADRDGDGRIHGGEAVDFFQRSGLGKDPLFQVRTSSCCCAHHLDHCRMRFLRMCDDRAIARARA
jgi:hypothetical protein